ncbi:hypothetical protein WI460_14700 [Gemmatimonadota bacterium Y43]|uniref:hypothetical protein n=1 Tax=Gaopeijia maritima TaxID=3119007 RepID=UPI0032814724
MLERLFSSGSEASRGLQVKSVLNPLLWLSGIVLPICLIAASQFPEPGIRLALVVSGLVPPGLTCLGFVYFAIRNPDKLQSEDFQIRVQTLQMRQMAEGHGGIEVPDGHPIANPVLGTLPKPKEAE